MGGPSQAYKDRSARSFECDWCGRSFLTKSRGASRVRCCQRSHSDALRRFEQGMTLASARRGSRRLPMRPQRECQWCGRPTTRYKYCSRKCTDLGYGLHRSVPVYYRECDACGDWFAAARVNARWCSKGCAKAFREWPITPKKRAKIIERDRGICQLCYFPVDPTDVKTAMGRDGRPVEIVGPLFPSMDHIVPRSIDPDHSMANLRLAHHGCNSRRGADTGPEALTPEGMRDLARLLRLEAAVLDELGSAAC